MSEFAYTPVWRVSYGATDREYLDVFTDHDVALVGYGARGEWPSEDGYADLGKGSWSSISTLAERVSVGHIVIATLGLWKIGAVGLAAADPGSDRPYSWNQQWVETEGWDLFHQIRVKWLTGGVRPPSAEKPFPRAYFASRVRDETVCRWARRRIEREHLQLRRPLKKTPPPERKLDFDEIPEPFQEAQRVVSDLRGAYGDRFWDIPESTIVAHQVVPLLRGLGFKASQIRLEWSGAWGRVDVAVVEEDNWEEPILIVEVKAPKYGLRWARQQGSGYGKALGDPPLLVTNGLILEFYGRGHYESPQERAYLEEPQARAQDLFNELKGLVPGSG